MQGEPVCAQFEMSAQTDLGVGDSKSISVHFVCEIYKKLNFPSLNVEYIVKQ